MSDKKNNFGLDDIDELLGATDPENRPDLGFADNKYEEVSSVSPDGPVPMATPEPEAAPQPDEIYIVDETSTSMVIEDAPTPETNPVADITYNQPVSQHIQPVQSVEKTAKKAKTKMKGWQIALIAVLGVITLWLVIFTTDHTLAANGLSPLFSKMTQEYEDGSQSFVGLGYKIQFQFDNKGDLTQKCVPIWEKGPNDTKFAE